MKNKLGIIFILISGCFWGTAGIFVRILGECKISSMEIVFLRVLFSAVILSVIIAFYNRTLFKIKIKDIYLFAASGILSIVLFNYCYYRTIALSTLSVAAILLYTAPFFVIIISTIFFKEKITFKKIACFIFAFLGCALVSGFFSSANRISPKCLMFGLLTGFGYSLYTVFGNLLLKKGYNSLTVNFYTFVFATLGTLPFLNLRNIKNVAFSNEKVLTVAFLMAVINTVLPYFFYTKGLKTVESSKAPIIAMIEPVTATVLGVLIYGEKLNMQTFAGIVIVIASVAVLNMQTKNMLKIKAFAKINLTLDICGKRQDGYHLLDTVMQSVSVFDKITLKKSDKITVKCSDDDINDKNNIAFIAAKTFFDKTGVSGGCNITIKKNIPKAAGMGGGSADAAAVILGLNKLYGTNLSEDMLIEIALLVGADVPFCLFGGTARVKGIGEKIQKMPFLCGYYLVAVKNGYKKSTAEMYKKIDSEPLKLPQTEDFLQSLCKENLSFTKYIGNAFLNVNETTDISEIFKKTNPLAFSLSGSGPSVFGIYKDKSDALKAVKILKSNNLNPFIAKPVQSGIIID